jgi:GNAT superfamily N-acetyltransferase
VQFFAIDHTSDEQFDAWFDVLRRSDVARSQGTSDGWQPSEWRARASDVDGPIFHRLYSYGPDITHPVAVGALEITRDDNLDWIRGELFVDPEQLRQGHGSAMLAHLEAAARDLDRQTILFWVIEDHHEMGRAANRPFAQRHGYQLLDEMIRRQIDWPRPAGALERQWEAWLPFATNYEILSWDGATPEELLNERAHLSAIMPLEAPSAGFEYEEERWDGDRVRTHERRADEMGRDLFASVARERASGHLVGFSELTISRAKPHTAYQWDTLVVGAHRGHRLGGLLKIANMRLLEASTHTPRRIITNNSILNTPMIAVNDELGAYVAGGMVGWTKTF